MKKKITAILLSCVLFIMSLTPAAAVDVCACSYEPVLIIPGFLQSVTHLYNEDGTLALKESGEEYTYPFFLEDTEDIVKQALGEAGLDLLSMLLTQSDDGDFAEKFALLAGEILAGRLRLDAQGKNDSVQPERYLQPYSQCSYDERTHIISTIPISDCINVVGGDHVYYFSYNSFGNLNDITAELYDMIELIKEQTGHDKINIVPISQGGTLFNNLLEYYPDVADSLNRVVCVIPALDGTELISDIYVNGLLDEPEALYGYMFPALLGEFGPLINIALRILPESVLNDLIDEVGDALFGVYLKYSTCMWAFLTTEDYEAAAEKYLSAPEDAYIREQTDAYQQARINSDKNILALRDKGVEVFDIVNYNVELYRICDSWDKVNADAIIHLDSTSMGAYSLGVDAVLPEDYVQQGNSFGTCSDPSHNHIDKRRIIDASTALLPDHTFYYYNGNHVETAGNDALIALVCRLLTDDSFVDVYSYPDEFPQFNEARNIIGVRTKLYESERLLAENYDEELAAAVSEVRTMLSQTVVDAEESQRIIDNFNEQYERATSSGESRAAAFFKKLFARIAAILDSLIFKIFGYGSFSGK